MPRSALMLIFKFSFTCIWFNECLKNKSRQKTVWCLAKKIYTLSSTREFRRKMWYSWKMVSKKKKNIRTDQVRTEGTISGAKYRETVGELLLQSAHSLRQEEHEWPRHQAKAKLEWPQIWVSLNDPAKVELGFQKNKGYRDLKHNHQSESIIFFKSDKTLDDLQGRSSSDLRLH